MAVQEAKFTPKRGVPDAPKEASFGELSPRGKTIASALQVQTRVGEWCAVLLLISPFAIAGIIAGSPYQQWYLAVSLILATITLPVIWLVATWVVQDPKRVMKDPIAYAKRSEWYFRFLKVLAWLNVAIYFILN